MPTSQHVEEAEEVVKYITYRGCQLKLILRTKMVIMIIASIGGTFPRRDGNQWE